MDIGYKVRPLFCPPIIGVAVEYVDTFNDVRTEISRRIANTEEALFKQQLIALGWTPPCQDQTTTGAASKESAPGTGEEHF